MTKVNVHQAKTQLSKLLQQVEAGEKIVIARGGAVFWGGDRGTSWSISGGLTFRF